LELSGASRPSLVHAVGALPSVLIRADQPPWDRDAPPATLQEWLDASGRLVARGGQSRGQWFMDWPGLGVYVFGVTGDVDAYPLPGVDAARVHDIFVRGVLPNVMLGRGLECFHSSAVVHDGRVFAFSGRSGIGKSTLALALAAGGLEHWADDTVLLADAPERPLTLSLPFPARVDDTGRAAIELDDTRYRKAMPETTAPIARIYLPIRNDSLDSSTITFTPLEPQIAFKRVLPFVHPFELDGMPRHRRLIENWLSFARKVPVWELRFAPSLTSLRGLAETVGRHIAAH